jgi:hypothetical protein
LERVEEFGGARRGGSRRENGVRVRAKHGEPGREVLRMIRAWRVRDAEVGGEKRGGQLSDQLFDGVVVVAEAFAKAARKARIRAGPMREFVKRGRVVALGRGARWCTDESGGGRNDYFVCRGPVERPRSGVTNPCACRCNERVDPRVAVDAAGDNRRSFDGETVNLIRVKDVRRARNKARVGVVTVVGRVEFAIKDDSRGAFALANLRTERGPLAIGRPRRAVVAAKLCCSPKTDDVDPAIGVSRRRVSRAKVL